MRARKETANLSLSQDRCPDGWQADPFPAGNARRRMFPDDAVGYGSRSGAVRGRISNDSIKINRSMRCVSPSRAHMSPSRSRYRPSTHRIKRSAGCLIRFHQNFRGGVALHGIRIDRRIGSVADGYQIRESRKVYGVDPSRKADRKASYYRTGFIHEITITGIEIASHLILG